jgi:hypothetical protein
MENNSNGNLVLLRGKIKMVIKFNYQDYCTTNLFSNMRLKNN